MFEDQVEFEVLAKGIGAIRAKSQELRRSTSQSARLKASVLDGMLQSWDQAILRFNRLDTATLSATQLELEKLFLRAAFMLPLLRLSPDTIDRLATHRHKRTIALRAGVWLGALFGGAAGGAMLGSPFLAIPGACMGHVAGSVAIKSEPSLPESIQLVLNFGRSIQRSYKKPEAYDEAYRAFQSDITADREFVWVSKPSEGMMACSPGKLYFYTNADGDLLCQEGDQVYDLCPYLSKAESTRPFASGFQVFLPDPLDKYRQINTAILQAAYIQAAIDQELKKTGPQYESSEACCSSSTVFA
ncbi:hypothetical protein [Legionella sp. CNM-4043-24]|uniref:hypothetical protein n=1 Tax=Legionella sp. CNM-4043-24 TaxID=3421646 RepID=UPI00403ACA09